MRASNTISSGSSPEKMAEPKYRQVGDLLTVGIMFPTCIAIGYGMGWMLDRWFGTQMVFKIIFLLFGMAAGFINLFRLVGKIEKNGDE
jgi:ATP synthase protein I